MVLEMSDGTETSRYRLLQQLQATSPFLGAQSEIAGDLAKAEGFQFLRDGQNQHSQRSMVNDPLLGIMC